jgi:hypothetical protein
MDNRLLRDSAWVRALSAKLRTASPHMFAPEAPEVSPRVVPAPASQPAREAVPAETTSAEPGLSSVMAAMDAARVARAEAEQRAADPVEQQRARLDELAHQMTSEEVFAVQECLDLARTDQRFRAACIREVVEYLDVVEQHGTL